MEHQRRGSVLGYLAEVEPLMEPTGGYPIIVPRTPDSAATRQPAPLSALGAPAPAPERPRRRQWILVIVLLVVITVLVTLLLAVQHRQHTGHVPLPLPSGMAVAAPATTAPAVVGPSDGAGAPAGVDPSAAPGSSTAVVAPSASTSVDPSASPSASPAPVVVLRARYETVGNTGLLGLTGYKGRVTITNPGTRPANGWQVTLVLPGGQSIASADGAGFQDNSGTVTFTPTDATAEVPATGSVTFTFEVNGLLGGPPTACAVNGHPCD